MRNVLIVLVTIMALTAPSATLPRGNDRLRELAVVPQMKMNFGIQLQSSTFLENLTEEGTLEDWTERARKKLKEEPEDLAAQFQLGRLLDANDNTNAARKSFEKAATLGRRRLEQRPNDGYNQTLLAGALWNLDNKQEAESIYRRATAVASNDWRCWIGLGEFLQSQSFSLTFGVQTNSHKETSHSETLPYRASPQELDQAVKLRDEASACFQRAYEIAPKEFEVLIWRGRYLSFSNWQAKVVQQYQNGNPLSDENIALDFASIFFSTAMRPDFEKALAVRPQCHKLLTTLAFTEWMTVLKEAGRLGSSHQLTLEELPETSRKVILDYLQRLEALGGGPDKKIAAAALTSFCILKMQFGETQNLPANMERAVEFDPGNEQAWDMLVAMSARQVPAEKFTELCERRLKAKQSARNHLIVSKALYMQKRFKESAAQAKAAFEMEPKDVPTVLMLAALAIRQGNELEEAKDFLREARKLVEDLSDEEEVSGRKREIGLNVAIVFALDGDSATARKLLAKILESLPDDKDARDIRDALP